MGCCFANEARLSVLAVPPECVFPVPTFGDIDVHETPGAEKLTIRGVDVFLATVTLAHVYLEMKDQARLPRSMLNA